MILQLTKSSSSTGAAEVLRATALSVKVKAGGCDLRIVSDFSLHIGRGEIVGIVGESGSGKSVLAQALTRLFPLASAFSVSGELSFQGHDLMAFTEAQLRAIRGTGFGMVFQDPMTSLNPVMRIGSQLKEAIMAHEPALSNRAVRERALELLELVRLPDPLQAYSAYPFQLSGGMRQRAMIAMALSCKPALLIADEPTTALDVTIQQEILELFKSLRDELGMSVLMITHDMDVINSICDKVIVMYAGEKVEEASVEKFFAQPSHPYSHALLQAIPSRAAVGERLQEIPGMVAAPSERGTGCAFAPRCGFANTLCRVMKPQAQAIDAADATHLVACHRYGVSNGVKNDN